MGFHAGNLRCLVFFYRGSFLTTEHYPVVVVLGNCCTASPEGLAGDDPPPTLALLSPVAVLP